MNKEQVIGLARQAGFLVDGDSWIHAGAVLVDGRKSIDNMLIAFANLVAAAERAECAKLCEDEAWRLKKLAVDTNSSSTNTKAIQASNDSDSIRARSWHER